MNPRIMITWQTPEYFSRERGTDWYWAVGIIGAAIILTAILLDNVLLAVFFLIAIITIFIYAKRSPDTINVEVSENGIRAGRNMYPYSTLSAFSLKSGSHSPLLLLKSGSVLNPLIVIPIVKTDPEKVRDILAQYIPNEEIDEPLSQKLLEYLGF